MKWPDRSTWSLILSLFAFAVSFFSLGFQTGLYLSQQKGPR